MTFDDKNQRPFDAEYRRIWLRFQAADREGKGVRLTAEEVHVLAQTIFIAD